MTRNRGGESMTRRMPLSELLRQLANYNVDQLVDAQPANDQIDEQQIKERAQLAAMRMKKARAK